MSGPALALDPKELVERQTTVATFRYDRQWSTSFFVRHVPAQEADAPHLRSHATVGASLTGKLSKNLRVSFDVVNLFDRKPPSADYFGTSFVPAPEGRGFQVRITRSF